MKVAIGVPTMNNFRGLAELFASLWGESYTPFVVNNWSHNNGVSKAWNEVLRATTSYDLVVICNDDIVFLPGSFRALLDGYAFAPMGSIMTTGINGDSVEEFMKAPDYSCFAVNPSRYLNEVGWFDENFTPAYFEDNDSHYRIKLSGHEAYCYNKAKIMHKGSQTQNANPKSPVVTSQMFERNRSYYVEKWGGWPGKETLRNPYNDSTKDWKYWRDC